MRLKSTALGLAFASLAVVNPALGADIAPPPGLTVNGHAVVVKSTVRECRNEDSGNRHGACTWNVGTAGQGLGLWYAARSMRTHYVWPVDPVVNHPHHNRWLTKAQRAEFRHHADGRRHRPWNRCYLHIGGTDSVRCPNGDWYSVS